MKKLLIKLSLLGLASFAMLSTSCEQDQEITVDQKESTLELAKKHAEEIGYNPDDIDIRDFHYPDGTIEKRIYIEDDIALLEEQFFALEQINSFTKQFRTNNLVTGNNQYGLSSKAQTGLRWAVANYNRLNNVTLNFRLTFGTNLNNADMYVYDTSFNTSDQGGVAGFPDSSGRPHDAIQIYNLESFSTNVNEHVITHEIGHSIGFRHSDWFSRQSCGQSGESAGSNGANYISGTVNGWDPTSLMNACFSAQSDGEFNANDKIALDQMY